MDNTAADTMSAISDSEGCLTPTTSVFPEPDTYYHHSSTLSLNATGSYLRSFPQPGKKFIIREPKTGLLIALKRGALGLHSDPTQVYSILGRPIAHNNGGHWRCIENEDMWLGFQNEVSGTYIGRDKQCKTFIAKADSHRSWEQFCVRQHPDGGHMLLVRHEGGFRAMRVGGEGGRGLIVGSKGERGTVFEFIELDSED
ncbi:hypothetical protein BDW67DRAFT_169153 [Aspergillus spinulosporus]